MASLSIAFILFSRVASDTARKGEIVFRPYHQIPRLINSLRIDFRWIYPEPDNINAMSRKLLLQLNMAVESWKRFARIQAAWVLT
jgi:hypothetical protein